MGRVLVFDIETHGADLIYTMPPERFVRLIGYKVDNQDVRITTNLEEIRQEIRSARWVVGHNIHAFDLKAVFGPDSNEPLELADAGRVYDTLTHGTLVNPAPYHYVNRFGQDAYADEPEKAKKWFKLDEQAYQLGVRRKTDDLDALAREFGDPELTGRARIIDGYGKIPVDDPRYRDYLVGDVLASEALGRKLLELGPLDAYAMRQQRKDARAAVISSNGIRVMQDKAQDRADQLAARRAVILEDLQKRYGLPTEGDAPWDTKEGRAAILAVLADYGITPDTRDWPRTPAWENREEKKAEALAKAAKERDKADGWRKELAAGGVWKDDHLKPLTARQVAARERWITEADAKAEEIEADPLGPGFGLSMGGKELIALTKDTPAAELGQALAELKGQRSLAQLALDSVHPDGFAHPEITMLQRSGRSSTTKPGLTIWTAKGPGAVEKEYFGPDNDDEVLLEIDLSNADARVVAWLSGDDKYAERFEPGKDGHLINAWAAWGRDVVGNETNEHGEFIGVTKEYRDKAKPLGHGWSYGGRPKGLAKASGLPLEEAEVFVKGMDSQFARLVKWQQSVRAFARRNGYVVNPWGRKMWVEKGREFTQAPALMGQSGTAELVWDALLAMPPKALRRVKITIHDALVFSVPRRTFEAWRDYFIDVMTRHLKAPKGGLDMDFPVGAGGPGENWREAHP